MTHVAFVYLFATPQSGAAIADAARHFSGSPLLDDLKVSNNLDEVHDAWKRLPLLNVKRFCDAETEPIGHWPFKAKVVPYNGATCNCSRGRILPELDHFTIVKPPDRLHLAYLNLKTAICDEEIATNQGKNLSVVCSGAQ